jgi:uncharacterized protein (TIGR00106 family)
MILYGRDNQGVRMMDNSVIAEIKIYPFGTGASVSHIVAACVNVLGKTTDVSYQVTPMATIVQGSLDRILELVKEMHELPFSQGTQRVVTSISIDDRRDKSITMESKVKAVKDKIQDL